MADKQGELDFGEKEKTWAEKRAEQKAQKAEEKAAEEKAKAEEKAAKEKTKQEEKAQKEKEKAEKKAERQEKVQDFLESLNPLNALTTGVNKAEQLTEEQKAELNAKAAEEQKADISTLKSETTALEKENVEENKNSAENQIKAMEDLLKKHIDNIDNSFIYNETPRTIRQAYKSGKFGQVMTDELRKEFRDEMRKPKEERNSEVLEKYQKAKDAQNARNFYIMDAIATGMSNVGSALQGGQGGKETKWNQLQGKRIADAQQRYKDLLDTKANEVVESAKNAGVMNRENEKALRQLYQDKRLQPILNKLDVDTQTQMLRLIDQKAGALSFDTFINALALQLMNNPGGAIESVFGAVDKLK